MNEVAPNSGKDETIPVRQCGDIKAEKSGQLIRINSHYCQHNLALFF